MKLFLALLVALGFSSTHAAPKNNGSLKPAIYDLKMDLSVEGGPVQSMSLIVQEGQLGMISQSTDEQGTFIEVLATKSTNGIMMKFAVGNISKKGERLVLSRPEILAQENQRAQITVGESNPAQELISLAVVAKRVPEKP